MFTLSHFSHHLLGFTSSFKFFFFSCRSIPSQPTRNSHGHFVKKLTVNIPEPEHPQAPLVSPPFHTSPILSMQMSDAGGPSGSSSNSVVLSDQQFAMLMECFASANTLTPPPATEPMAIPPFVPLTNATSGESILDHFPTISRSIVLEVIRHEIAPLNLYKLDVNATEKAAKAKNMLDFEDSNLTVKQCMGGIKDYPSFASFLDLLLIYFNILGFHAASSGQAHAILAILDACTAYTTQLLLFYCSYAWTVVLSYHKHFFLQRQHEMLQGKFSGWKVANGNLVTLYLMPFPHTPTSASKSSKSSAGSALSASSLLCTLPAQKFCFNFNKGTCTASPCLAGRMHKCQKCDTSGHGASNCTKGQ